MLISVADERVQYNRAEFPDVISWKRCDVTPRFQSAVIAKSFIRESVSLD